MTAVKKPRRWWVAGLVAILCPGLGHLYVGRPIAAILIEVVPPIALSICLLAGALIRGALFPCFAGVVAGYLGLWLGQAVWASWLARQAGAEYELAPFNRFLVYLAFWIGSIFSTNVLVRPLRHWVVEPYLIPATSMSPTLLMGDHVLVVKAGPESRLERGDVVVYRAPPSDDGPVSPGTNLVSRLIATGGDRVEVREREVAVNGTTFETKPCTPPAITLVASAETPPQPVDCFEERNVDGRAYPVIHFQEPGRHPRSGPPHALTADQLFFMADNRDNAYDGRYWGPSERSAVVGRAVVVWFSFSIDDGIRWRRMGTKL